MPADAAGRLAVVVGANRGIGLEIYLLVLVAGYQAVDALGKLDAAGLRRHFDVNSIGPLLVTQALRGHLVDRSKVVLISSKMGSIGDGKTGGGLYGYRMSKAAANCAGATLARDLRNIGIAVGVIHPGAVRVPGLHPPALQVDTDMCRACRTALGCAPENLLKGLLAPDDSARRVVGLIDRLSLDSSGTFWAADTGVVLPW